MIGRAVSPTDGFIFGIAAESEPDAKTVTGLADRAACAGVGWLDGEQLEPMRRWAGPGGTDWLDLHRAQRDGRAAFGMRAGGHFNGEPGALDAHMIRSALLLFQHDAEPFEIVIIARDLDDRPQRRAGFEQAVNAGQWPFDIVGALAQPEIEAWVLAGFEPQTEVEREGLRSQRAALGFDPTRAPERLKSGRTTNPRDCKRVCSTLTGADRERRAQCLAQPLDTLRSRGAGCGLAAFLDDAQATLARRIDPRREA